MLDMDHHLLGLGWTNTIAVASTSTAVATWPTCLARLRQLIATALCLLLTSHEDRDSKRQKADKPSFHCSAQTLNEGLSAFCLPPAGP